MSASPQRRSARPLRFTLALAGLFGALFVAINPPLQIPDEAEHLERVHALTAGAVWRDPTIDGVRLDAALVAMTRGPFSRLPVERERRIDLVEVVDILRAPPGQGTVIAPMYPYASPVPYAPAALVVGVASALGIRPAGTLYLTRLLHLALYLVAVAAVFVIMPYARSAVVAFMLAPAPLYLGGGMSPDPLLFATTFVFIAIVCAWHAGTITFSRGAALGALGCALVFALVKPPYFLLSALVLMVPRARFASARARFIWCGLLIGLPVVAAVGFNLYVMSSVAQSLTEMRSGVDVSVSRQLGFMLSHPMESSLTILRGLRPVWLHHAVGAFGWMDSALPPALSVVYLVGCGAAAVFATSAKRPSPALVRVGVALAAGLALAVSALLYVSFTAVGGAEVEGLQGRYFVPFAPLLLVAAAGSRPRRSVAEATLLRWLPAWLSVFWIAACVTLARRYYLP